MKSQDPRESIRPESFPETVSYLPGRDSQDSLPTMEFVRGEKFGEGGQDEFPGLNPTGDYVLNEIIGRGSEGEVWSAVQVTLDRVVAVKIIAPSKIKKDSEIPGKKQFRERRFYGEALIAARLDHPNIVPIHDISRGEDGAPLIAMKMVKGEPWSELLKEDFHSLPADLFLQKHLPIFISMMQAVAFAHSQGVIHRDLKPSQVMVGEFGEVVLLDWGIAVLEEEAEKKYRQDLGTPPPLTSLPTIGTAPNPAGTPSLMAPEQTWENTSGISRRTDIYLLGSILHFLLTGTFPHDSESAELSVCRASEGKIIPLKERAPEGRDLPEELVALTLKALEPKPEDRIDSAKTFITSIQDFLTGATSHRQSMELTDQAREKLDDLSTFGVLFQEEEDGYTISIDAESSLIDEIHLKLEEIRVVLEKATSEWSTNPAIKGLKDRVTAASSMCAALAGDLRMARLFCNRLADGKARENLREIIGVQVKERRRKDKIRRGAIAAVVVLVLVLSAGGFKYITDQRNMLEKISIERDLASQMRDEAIRQEGKTAIAMSLAEEEAYFAKMNLAGFAFREGNPYRVRELLMENRTSPHRHWEWGHFMTLLSNDAMTVTRSHGGGSLLSCAWSRDGSLMYSGNRDGDLSIWESHTGKLLERITFHEDGIWDIVPSHDGTMLLLCSFDSTASIVNTTTLEVIHRLVGHRALLRGGAFSPDGRTVVTTSRDGTAKIWDVETGEEVYQIQGETRGTYAAAFSPDGDLLVIAGRRTVTIHDGRTGEQVGRLPQHPENVLGIAFSPDGTKLVTAFTDRIARVFDVVTQGELFSMNQETSWLHSIDWSPDGKLIATGGNGSEIRLWDAFTGEHLETLQGNPRVFHLAFSPTSDRLLTVTPGILQVWMIDEFSGFGGISRVTPMSGLHPEPQVISYARSSPMEIDGAWLGYDWVYRQPTGYGRLTYEFMDLVIAADSHYAAIEPNQQRVVRTIYRELDAVVEDFHSRELIHPWPHGRIFMARWSPDGTHLGVITPEGAFMLHDGQTLEPRHQLGELSPISGITRARVVGVIGFDKKSERVFTGRRDGSVDIWSTSDGSHLLRLENPGDGVFAGRFSPDGSLLATGGLDFKTYIWDTATGENLSVLSGHRDFILDIDIHPDNNRVLTISHDNQVKLWETRKGREIMTVVDFPDERYALGGGFSPSGREVYVLVSDGSVHIAEAFNWETTGEIADLILAAELEKRQRRINPDITMEDLDISELVLIEE